jgi:hypothetical protein
MKELLSGEIITIWEGRGENDTNEGRGGTHTVGWYLTNAEATEGVKSEGVWGGPGTVKSHQALRQVMPDSNFGQYIYWKIEKINVQSNKDYVESVRKSALAKLTDEEKRVLGVK